MPSNTPQIGGQLCGQKKHNLMVVSQTHSSPIVIQSELADR